MSDKKDISVEESKQTSVQPLVSVVVVTYNSSGTVLETLDSIKRQTYSNIELIISDDCSSDDTVNVCRAWLNKNTSRFANSEIVSTIQNTGVSGNLNRGVKQSHGEWIKSIAGDDMLVPSAIEEYINFIYENTDKVRMCVCDVEPFTENGVKPTRVIERYKRYFELEGENYEQQRKRVLTSLVFIGPAFFYSRELYDEVGGFTEKYGCAEEWPFVYKVIRGGNRIYAFNKKLVRYRVQAQSLCHTEDNLGSKRVFDGMYRHFFDYAFKDLILEGQIITALRQAKSYLRRRWLFFKNK